MGFIAGKKDFTGTLLSAILPHSVLHPAAAHVQAVLSCLCYAACSTMLSLANKAIFSSRRLNYPWSLLCIQSMVCAILLALYYILTTRRSPLRTTLFRELLFPCVVFSAFIFTSARALRYISLPVLSVIKSFAPMGIAVTELFLFQDHIRPGTYAAMLLVLLGNAVMVLNDLEYNPTGYLWATLNTLANIVYVVSLRYCVDKTHKNGEKALHLNVLLSILMPACAYAAGEWPEFFVDFQLTTYQFRLLFFFSCILAAGIGASVFWVIQTTSGSTCSFVGAANKVNVIVLGAVLFEVKINALGWTGILLGVLGSIAFTVSKIRTSPPPATAKREEPDEEPALLSKGRITESVTAPLLGTIREKDAMAATEAKRGGE